MFLGRSLAAEEVCKIFTKPKSFDTASDYLDALTNALDTLATRYGFKPPVLEGMFLGGGDRPGGGEVAEPKLSPREIYV